MTRYFWLMPFFCFIGGYYTIAFFMGSQTIETPAFTGQSLHDVVANLAACRLSMRILGTVEEPTLPDGTVISQNPLAGQKIKFYQPVGIIISRAPPALLAPDFRGMTKENILECAQAIGARVKFYWCPSFSSLNNCIAQFPSAGCSLPTKTIFAYLSSGLTPLRLVPDFCGKTHSEVEEFLKQHGMVVEILPGAQSNAPGIIMAQKPPAGSFIDINTQKIVQLYVSN